MISTLTIKALGWTVLHSLWQGTMIAFLLWIIYAFIREKKANTRYILGNLALLLQLSISAVTFKRYFQTDSISVVSSNLSQQSVFSTPTEGQSTLLPYLAHFFNQHIDTIVLLWIFGVILFTIKMMMGYAYLYQLRNRHLSEIGDKIITKVNIISEQLSIKKHIRVHESALIDTPMVTGWLKPMILFPIGLVNQLSPTEIEAILAHELAHISRNDILFNFLQSLTEILYYYHPAIWWISNQIRQQREYSCDDIALQLTGSQLEYAKALLNVQCFAKAPQLVLGFSGKKGQLLTRVQRVLSPTEIKNSILEKIILSAIILGAVFTMSFQTYHDVPLDTLLADNLTTININSLSNQAYIINVDSFPSGENHFYLQKDNQNINIKIENGAITYIDIDGKKIPKEKYKGLEISEVKPRLKNDDSIKVYVSNKDSLIIHGEEMFLLRGNNSPFITINTNQHGNRKMLISLGDQKFDVLNSDQDSLTAFMIKKVIKDNEGSEPNRTIFRKNMDDSKSIIYPLGMRYK